MTTRYAFYCNLLQLLCLLLPTTITTIQQKAKWNLGHLGLKFLVSKDGKRLLGYGI